MRYFIFLFFFLYSCHLHCQSNETQIYNNVYKFRDSAENDSYSLSKRILYARKAMSFSDLTKNDSTILKSNRILSLLFIKNQDFDSLYSINFKNLKLAAKLKDSLKMAYASHNIGYHFEINNKVDSAYAYYFKARKYYNASNKKAR